MPSVYRYDEADFTPGEVVVSRGDHISELTGKQRAAEEAIRKRSSDWERIRSKSLYVWKDNDVAETLWRKAVKPYHLYELAIDDIEHIGDIAYFTMLEETISNGMSAADYALWKYTERFSARSYIEILVKRATVLRKLHDVSEKAQ